MSIAKTCDFLAIQKILGYKILSYVGNITDNKNQVELIRLMPKLKNEKIITILAGREADEGKIRKYIIDHSISDSVILGGFCSEMDSIWINADLNIFLSKNDGFGLSIIEGYMRGVPSMMYDDLDAVDDVLDYGLYTLHRDSSALLHQILMKEKSANDTKIIMKESYRYSLKQMRRNYTAAYKKLMER